MQNIRMILIQDNSLYAMLVGQCDLMLFWLSLLNKMLYLLDMKI